MSKKLTVMTILGTRPEIIRLSRIIFALDKNTNHIIVHTGQNYDYELNKVFFDDLRIRTPDYFLDSANHNNGLAKTIGNIIYFADKIIEKLKPDALLVLGDTNSCLSVIPAKRRKIPIFHIEAGNRCFDLRVPEEINRKIVDHTSDINLTYSAIAREYLISEGVDSDMVINVGSPMKEVLEFHKNEIESSNILQKYNLKTEKYFLVSAHREENIENPILFKKLINSLNYLSVEYNLPIIFSTHPRTKKKIDKEKCKLNNLIKLLKPQGYFDYLKLQLNSKVVLSDSGSISEESSILNFPAINIREAHERPEAMEEGSVMMSGLDYKRIKQCISIIENEKIMGISPPKIVRDYSSQNVSQKVLRIIQSYTDYVNRKVWKKY